MKEKAIKNMFNFHNERPWAARGHLWQSKPNFDHPEAITAPDPRPPPHHTHTQNHTHRIQTSISPPPREATFTD